jgi:hypothetical protein
MENMTIKYRAVGFGLEWPGDGVAASLLKGGMMIRPVTGHVTASEPHDIADARSSTPPK